MVASFVRPIQIRQYNVQAIRLELPNELRAEGRLQVRELRKTVTFWQGVRPGFEALIGLTARAATLVVGPTGTLKAVQKWTWADEGTRPHVIRARRAPRLKFRTGFRPKTTPRRFASGPGGSFGPWVSPLSVRHPGTRKRRWSETLMKKRRPKYSKRMDAAIARGIGKLR